MANLVLPELLKHMALAIYAKGYVRGTKIQQLVESLNIARGQLAAWGYLTAGSAKGPLTKVKLTGKGAARTAHHRKEKGGRVKTATFDVLYAPILEAYEQKRTQESEMLPAGAKAEDRKHQRNLRVVKAALSAAKPPTRKPRPHRIKRVRVTRAVLKKERK